MSEQQNHIDEIEELMSAARRRVVHALLIVLCTLVAISSQIPWSGVFDARKLMAVGYWVFGCIVILTLLVVWYRARVAATARLTDLLRAGACQVHRIDKTHLVLWHIFSLGYEIDVHLVSGEHLAFGFWTANDAEGLVLWLSQWQLNATGTGADEELEDDD